MQSIYLELVVTALVAAAVSVIDISVRRDKGIYPRALPLCVLYVVFDVSAALILLAPLRAGAKLMDNSPTVAAAVVAGLIAPLLMRTKVPVPFTKGKHVVNGVAMLRYLQVRVSGEIDDVCAAGETAWILDKVLPAITKLTIAEIEVWVIESINVRYKAPEARSIRRKHIEDVRKIASDPGDEEEKKHLLVQVLIDRCGRRQAIALVRRSRKKAGGK